MVNCKVPSFLWSAGSNWSNDLEKCEFATQRRRLERTGGGGGVERVLLLLLRGRS